MNLSALRKSSKSNGQSTHANGASHPFGDTVVQVAAPTTAVQHTAGKLDDADLAAIIESSSDAIVGKTLDGDIVSWNAGAEALYGYSADEVIGRNISILVPPGQPSEMPSLLKRIADGEQVEHYETERVRKDGKRIYMSLGLSPIKDAEGRCVGVSSIARDITARKRAEDALRRNIEQYRTIARNFPNGAIFLFDTEMRYLLADGSDLAPRGYGNIEGKTLYEVLPEPVAKSVEPLYKAALEGRTLVQEVKRPDGVWESTAVPLRDEDGEIFGGMIVSSNVTARKQTEQALRRTIEEYRTLARNFPNGAVFLFDKEMRYIVADGTDLVPRGHGNIEGKTLYEALPEATARYVEPLYKAALEGRTLVQEVVAPGGVWECTAVPVLDKDGEVFAGMIVAHNVTERKKSEEALRRTAEQYRTLARHFPQGAVFLFDKEMRYLLADGTDLASRGYGSIEGKTLWEVLPEPVARSVEPLYRAALEGRTLVQEVKRPDGIWESTAVPVRDEHGEVFAGMIVSHNVTERKLAEQALLAANERFEAVANAANALLWDYDIQGDKLWWNESHKKASGLSEGEEPTMNLWRSRIHPDDLDRVLARLQSAMESDSTVWADEFRVLVIDPDKGAADAATYMEVFDRGTIVRDESGKPVRAFGAMVDITERKRAEQRLKESEQRFRMLFADNPLPMWVYDLNSLCFLEVNDAAIAHYGYTRDEFLTMQITDIRPQEEQNRLIDDLSQPRPRHQISGEWQHRTKSGKVIQVQITSHLFNIDGRNAVLVTAEDITERKQYEGQLKEYARAQSHLLSQLMRAQEAERRRLSMEIHDGPLQSLGVSLMALDRAMLRQGRGDQDMADRELKFLRQTLADTVSEMRQVLADLSQEVLSSYGMVVALQHHAERFTNATGINVEVHTKVSRRLPADKELLLYRLAQEAMANARKHADAHNVVIRLEMRAGEVQLRIRDDGKGFSVDEALKRHEDGKGIGLRSMRHRIEAAGGSMRIQSAPGRGTMISFRCPVADPTAQSAPLTPLPDDAE